jgi:hypothetical protein
MNDWATFNQTDLFGFLQEFKNEYGDIGKLKARSAAEAWKEEPKSSIIERLELDGIRTLMK